MPKNLYSHLKTKHMMAEEEEAFEPSRLDRLTKQKIGNIPGILDWIPDAEKQRSRYPVGIAATVLLILGFSALLWLRSRPGVLTATRPIEAMLHWQLGTNAIDSLALEEMKQDTPYRVDAIQIARMGNEFFIRERQEGRAALKDSLIYHIYLKGSENIQVFFEDSTRVQLGQRSALSFVVYPIGIVQKERQLNCDGEILVDVSPDYQIPTKIKTRRQQIAVLGTFFKLRDYQTEDTSAVLCYRGKVAVSDSASKTTILHAAQRATVLPGRNIKVSSNDFPIAHWSSKELLFDFSNQDLDDAMREIARWYGMPRVQFEGSVDRKTRGMVFTGPLSRYLSLQKLLSILEREDLHFSIRGKTILVEGTGGRLDHNH